MNYLTPAAYEHLPPRARCSMGMVYSLIIASAKSTASGECDRTQGSLASWLGCDVRTIKRHEKRLVELGLLEVVHHGRSNRRRLRVVEVKRRLKIAGEWGQKCPHGGDRIVPTLGREAISLSTEKNPSEERRAPRAGNQRGSSIPRVKTGGLPEMAQRALTPAVASFVRRCNIDRKGIPNVVELVESMALVLGVRRTVERLEWSAAKNATVKDPERLASMSVGLLRSMVAKLEEKGAPRTRGARSTAS